MKNDTSGIFGFLLWVGFIILHIVNFIQLLAAASNEEWGLVIVKLIGHFTAFGVLFTVWF